MVGGQSVLARLANKLSGCIDIFIMWAHSFQEPNANISEMPFLWEQQDKLCSVLLANIYEGLCP